jgi:hypothetical protein
MVGYVSLHRQAWSATGPYGWSVTTMRSFYADQVLYHEKLMTADEVILAKLRFADKAPIRSYKIRANPIVVCAVDTCDVQGLMDWRTVDKKGEAGSGVATFAYKVKWVDKSLKITLETSKDLLTTPEAGAVPVNKAPKFVKRDPCRVDAWVCRALRQQKGIQ